ncbi:hypothetical protein EBB07_00805 [Paenibacillaceae bacterium]|nr:hypothetical protein EBB07_00805 [Paenibacillaceae bacterium]
MQYQVNKGFVKHQGALYGRGSLFDADPGDVFHLLQSGKLTETTPLQPGHIPPPEGGETVELPTLEEFSKLTAEKQKELLFKVDIDPASNADQRLQQYTDLYEEADEHDDI